MHLRASRRLRDDDPNLDPSWDWTVVGPGHTMYYSLSGETPVRLDNVQVPFYSGGHPLNTDPRDMWPQDGWMLAYRDFGTPSEAPPLPFFALYNKYRGILRVMFYNAPNIAYSYYRSDLSFVSPGASGALLTFTDPTRCTRHSYNPEKRESFIGLTTQFRGWTYADFVVLGHDPATNPDARFRFEIFGIDETKVQLESTQFTLAEVATDSNPAASQSKFEDAIDAFNRGHKWYKTVDDVLTALAEKVEDTDGNPWWKAPASGIVALAGACYAPYVAGALGFISFFLGGSSKAAPREPLNFSGSLQLEGALTLTQPIVAADFALFPGPIESYYYRPVQPIPWGLFNLATSPLVYTETVEITSEYGTNECEWREIEFEVNLDDYVFRTDAGVRLKSILAAFTYSDRAPSKLVDPSTLSEHLSEHRPLSVPWACGPYSSGATPNGVALEIRLEVIEPVLHSDSEIVIYKVYPCPDCPTPWFTSGG